MKKPKFNLFYSFMIFEGIEKNTASTTPEYTTSDFRKEVKDSTNTIFHAATTVIMNIANKRGTSVIGIVEKDPQAKEARETSDRFEAVAGGLKANVLDEELKPEDAKKKLDYYKNKAAKKLVEINERIEKMDEMKKLCKETLAKQYKREFGVAQSEMLYLAEGAVAPKRIKYIVEAYLNRWYEKYNDYYFPKLSYDQLTALTQQIGDYKRGKKTLKGFKSGKMYEDLKIAYREMTLLVNNWREDGENSKRNYKNEGWDGWNVTFDRWKINGERKYRTGPLPDGEDFEKRQKEGFPPTSLAEFQKSLNAKKAPEKAPEKNPEDFSERIKLFTEALKKNKNDKMKFADISTAEMKKNNVVEYKVTYGGDEGVITFNAKTNEYKYSLKFNGVESKHDWKKATSPNEAAQKTIKGIVKMDVMFANMYEHYNKVLGLDKNLNALDKDYKFELQKRDAKEKEKFMNATGEYVMIVKNKDKAVGKLMIENDTIKYVSTKPPKTLDLSPHGLDGAKKILDSIKEGKEPIDPNAPQISSMSYKNGVLTIVGEKLPNQPISVELPKVIRSENLVKGGIAYEKTAVNNLAYGADNINALIIKNVLDKVPEGPFKKELAKSLTDRTKGIPILQEILAAGPKPTLRVCGRASCDGRYAGNVDIATKRAENGVKKIEAQLGGKKKAAQLVKLVPVPEVIDHKGNKITSAGQMTRVYMSMKKDWNVLPGSKGKELKSSAEMRKIVSNYVNGKVKGFTPDQLKFLKDSLDQKRNIQVEVVAPKKPAKFTIKFENPKPNA